MNVSTEGLPQGANHWHHSRTERPELDFAGKHLKNPAQFWKKILWTDETKINLYQNDGKRGVSRRKGTAHEPKSPHHPSDTMGVVLYRGKLELTRPDLWSVQQWF